MKKLLAFTLAETLIVIGIIGVVSALTLPNLNSSTGEKEKVAKVKKLYQNFDDALGRAVAIYGPLDEWIINDTTGPSQTTRFSERIIEFMKVSKNCGYGANNSCYKMATLKALSGIEAGGQEDEAYSFILADGTSVGVFGNGNFMQIEIDIDGPNRGANTFGKDVFAFRVLIAEGNLFPYGFGLSFTSIANNLKPSGTGYYSAYWVINYDNMDYLKLDSSGKCPNGSTPTESNPRCN